MAPSDRPVSVNAFAKAVEMTPRHVRRLLQAGLPSVEGARGPRIRLAEAKAWIAAAKRARTGGPAVEGRLALLNVQADGTEGRERNHRTLYVHEDSWAPAWRAQVAAVRDVLAGWSETAPARILEILQPGGPRLFPGNDPRALGYAIVEYVARPLLDQLTACVGEIPARPPAATSTQARETATTIQGAKTRLVLARTSELRIRTAVKTDRAWSPRGAVQTALREALANAQGEVLTTLPGRCVRLTGGPLTLPAIADAVTICVRDVLAALERPLRRTADSGAADPSAYSQSG